MIRTFRALRRALMREDAGQVLPMVIVILPVAIALLGMSVDLGFLYYERSQLQGATDAAALAAAQLLPDQSAALAAAKDYSATGSKNKGFDWLPVDQPDIEFKCTVKIFCNPSNAVQVTQT